MLANEPTWTAERVELLKSRFEAGLSCREIAGDIGVSRGGPGRGVPMSSGAHPTHHGCPRRYACGPALMTGLLIRPMAGTTIWLVAPGRSRWLDVAG